jgi:hypothetical protein
LEQALIDSRTASTLTLGIGLIYFKLASTLYINAEVKVWINYCMLWINMGALASRGAASEDPGLLFVPSWVSGNGSPKIGASSFTDALGFD